MREEEIDAIYFERSYYGAPDDRAAEPPASVSTLMPAPSEWGRESSPAGERERLSTLQPKQDALVLETMEWPDEIRFPAFQVPQVTIEATAAEESAS